MTVKKAETDNRKMREAMIDQGGAVWEEIGGAWSMYWPAQSVPVVGEPVAWVNINKHGDITRTVSRRDNWCTTPVFAKPKTSVLAAELATLREKAAEADELRKDAERYRKLRGWMSSNVKEGWGRVTDLSAVFCYVSWQEGDSYLDNLPECNVGLMQKDAAIAQEGE